MYHILTLNAISPVGLKALPEDRFVVSGESENPEGIILRSYDMHSMPLPPSLLGVARAGAGTNNIPLEDCAEKGIVVFNTPGANANAVKELVLAGLLLSSRKIVQGIQWVKSLAGQPDVAQQAEKGKKAFVGPEIQGKTLGIIGLGAVGSLIANAAVSLGMEVIGHDPYMNIDAAWKINSAVKKAASLQELVAKSDYITLHVPLTDQTRNLFDGELLRQVKKGARLLNFSRDGLVEPAALKDALADGALSCYVTDLPSPEVLGMENTIVLPHLGASTPEAEENCASMAAVELREFLLYGNIKNSVNFPQCILPYMPGKARIAIANKNIPNMIGAITTAFAKENINIDNMINKSKGAWAYTLVDADSLHGRGEALLQALYAIDGVVKARIVIDPEVEGKGQ